jgi:4-amino-4-deoxy-L-arabinose transferase-like glycosyltransferase
MFKKIISWVKANKKEVIILGIIILIAAIFRLYKIDQYMTFLGDEGRDVIIVRRIFTELHPPLIGPGTSIGGMYLGPLYYYMMAIPLLIANFSPIGPAVMVALLGVITVAFVWWVGRSWFGKMAGMIAAGLYAISPTIITFSRSSWNPNIMPFFSLLSIYSIWRVWRQKEYKWLLVLGVSVAFVLQSHYLGLLLAPVIFVFWLSSFLKVRKTSFQKTFIKKSILGFIIFLVLMSPLLIFDIRHGWMNTKAVYTFFTIRQTTVSIRPWTAVPKIPELFVQINTSLIGGMNVLAAKIASIFIAVGAAFIFVKNWQKKNWTKIPAQYVMLTLWMIFALIGFGIYKQNIYDHYFGFVFAVPYLFVGAFVAKLLESNKLLKLVGIVILGYFLAVNLYSNPLRFHPNKQLARSQHVSEKILMESGDKPFDLAVLAERNYEDGYRYFLELSGATVLHADRWDQKTIVDQLFVVCEMEEKKCDPTHSPKAEVANFGMSKIDMKWEVDGVIIYKLSHSN